MSNDLDTAFAKRLHFLSRRAAILREVRAFFVSRGALEVETPILVPSPGLDVHLDAFEVPKALGEKSHYLNTSPEYQMKVLLSEGFTSLFQITKVFRRDERGIHHNPEFTMLEWYRAGASVEELRNETAELVAHVTGKRVQLGTRTIDCSPPFEERTLASLFEEYAGLREDAFLNLAHTDEDTFFRTLVEDVEPKLALGNRPVFVTDYPTVFASLARRKDNDPRYSERFELYLAGVELCNGFGELTDPREQRARFEADQRERSRRGLPVYPIDESFLAALDRGLPACSGNALGLDRLIALACGTENIHDVLTFSRGT